MKKKPIGKKYALLLSNFKHIFRLMKLTFLLFLLCISSVWANNANSQTTKVNIQAENMHMKDIISQIESQTDYLFVYNNNVNTNLKVAVNATNQPVKQILDTLLPSIGLSYVQEGSYIVVSSSLKDDVKQQKVTIKGIVTDTKGEPIIGANIVEKGTTNGTITDIDGKYSIEATLSSILQITYIGYNSLDIPINNRKAINIQLKEDTQTIDEVIRGSEERESHRISLRHQDRKVDHCPYC